ncbi:MAG: FecR domain-containing protein [SAR324 cluster bacterium]|nr:FecR domain-containing protein [SAR324 cluster bacterium]
MIFKALKQALALAFSISAATSALGADLKVSYPQILQQKGEIYKNTKKGFVAIKEGDLLKITDHLQAGALGKKDNVTEKPKLLQKQKLVFSFSDKEIIVAPQGSQAKFTKIKKLPNYELTGYSTLIIKPQTKSYSFTLNGLKMESTTGATLYLVATKSVQQWTLDSGEVSAWLPKNKGKSTVQEKFILRTGERITKKKKTFDLERNPDYKDKVYLNAQAAGFTKVVPYKYAGKATFKGDFLMVDRGESREKLVGSPVPIFEGDIVKTGKGQEAKLNLETADLIIIQPESSFNLSQIETQKVQKSDFKFTGKIRVKAKKRKKKRSVRFRSATAVIGIKGTEFFASATAGETEVGTLEGLVGVADPDGKGEVLVEPGQKTRVKKGQLPEKPEAMEPAQLNELSKSAPTGNTEGQGPKIWPPLQLAFVTNLEGAPIKVAFNAPMTKIKLLVNGKEIPATIAEDKKTAEIDVVALFAAAAKKTTVKLEIEATGEDKAVAKSSTSLKLRHKPAKPPEITIAEGKTEIRTAKVEKLLIASDRKMSTWELSLDGKPVKPVTTKKDATSDTKGVLGLELSGGWLAGLKSGDHILEVKGTDEFDMASEVAKITLKVDQDAPFVTGLAVTPRPNSLGTPLVLGDLVTDAEKMKTTDKELAKSEPAKMLPMDNLPLKEGEGLTFKFNEKTTSTIIEVGKQKVELKPKAKGLEFEIAASDLSSLFKGNQKGEFTLYSTDDLGNEKAIKGQVEFSPLPSPAVLAWSFKGKSLASKGDKDLVFSSNQVVEKWEVKVNGKSLKLLELKSQPPFAVGQKVTISSVELLKLAEGSNKVEVTVWNDFQQDTTLPLALSLDQSAPKLVQIVPAMPLEWLSFMDKDVATFEFSEPLSEASAKVAGKKWAVKLSADKISLTLTASANLLGNKEQEFEIEVADQLGNKAVFKGWARIKPMGASALRDSYNESSLGNQIGDTDAGLEIDRIPFDARKPKIVK